MRTELKSFALGDDTVELYKEYSVCDTVYHLEYDVGNTKVSRVITSYDGAHCDYEIVVERIKRIKRIKKELNRKEEMDREKGKENQSCRNSTNMYASEYTYFANNSRNLDSCEYIHNSSFSTSMLYCNNVHFCRFSMYCENMIFTYNAPHRSQFMAFGKEVTPARFSQIKSIILDVFEDVYVQKNLCTTYNNVTPKMWRVIADLPEFDNAEVQRITAIDVRERIKDDKVLIECEGKKVWLSRESALALNLIEE
jgi:hypothetical protein